MKKLLVVSLLGLVLAACSHNENYPPHGGKMGGGHLSAELESAMQACHQASNKDMTAFDSCMKAKGFEKPADHPPVRPQSN